QLHRNVRSIDDDRGIAAGRYVDCRELACAVDRHRLGNAQGTVAAVVDAANLAARISHGECVSKCVARLLSAAGRHRGRVTARAKAADPCPVCLGGGRNDESHGDCCESNDRCEPTHGNASSGWVTPCVNTILPETIADDRMADTGAWGTDFPFTLS